MLSPKGGCAYPLAVTTRGIRLHLDKVQKACWAWITGLCLCPT